MGGRSSKPNRDHQRYCRIFGGCYEKDADKENPNQQMNSSQSMAPKEIGAILGGIFGAIVIIFVIAFLIRKKINK